MRWLALLAALGLQMLARSAYAIHLPFAGSVAPHFVLLVVFYHALEAGAYRTFWLALVGGLLLEGLSLDPWFSQTGGLLLGCLLLHFPALERWGEHALLRLPFLAVALAAATAARLAVLSLETPSFPLPAPSALCGSLLYDVALSIPLFGFLAALERGWKRECKQPLRI